MKALQSLPENYKEIFSINLQKDKKMSVLVNVFSLLLAAIVAVPMHFYIPFTSIVYLSDGMSDLILKEVVMLFGVVIYMILHELVHGIAMKLYGTKKVKYGFTGLYAFAGSNDYYDKKSYIVIGLAPIVVWGVVLAIINVLVPEEWFWIVYIIQITNISGAAGDIYVSLKFSKFPKDILVQDYGVGMTVYSKEDR